jgi:hypothetical protein
MAPSSIANVTIPISNWPRIRKVAYQFIHATNLLVEDVSMCARRKDKYQSADVNLDTPWRKMARVVKNFILVTKKTTVDVNIYARNVVRKGFANV